MELAIPHLRILDCARAVAFYVDAWSERLRQHGVPFESELGARPWGACDFMVHDPFGNAIVVTSGGA